MIARSASFVIDPRYSHRFGQPTREVSTITCNATARLPQDLPGFAEDCHAARYQQYLSTGSALLKWHPMTFRSTTQISDTITRILQQHLPAPSKTQQTSALK
jgi:hypothetical protein